MSWMMMIVSVPCWTNSQSEKLDGILLRDFLVQPFLWILLNENVGI